MQAVPRRRQRVAVVDVEDHALRGVRRVGRAGPRVSAEPVDLSRPKRADDEVLEGTIVMSTLAGQAKALVTHDRAKGAVRLVLRHGYFVGAGAVAVVQRWRDTHGGGRHERFLRGAEVAGDREAMLEWDARATAERNRRHHRIMDWIEAPLELAKAAALALVVALVGLLVMGALLAAHSRDLGRAIGPLFVAISATAWVVWFVFAYGALLLLGATVGGVVYLWSAGRSRAHLPGWALPPGAVGDGRQVVPDEGAILQALKNLNLAPLNKKFKEGWNPRWVLGTGRDGKGWRTQVELPLGVTVEMINNSKAVLAHNLVRKPVEVWPTEPRNQPGVLDLWVADSGLLTGPVDPYPLLAKGTCDYFRGVPVGIDQRGDVVTGKLMASNYGIAGTMGSGKTSLVIDLLAGGALDPICSLEVYCLAYNVDYDPFEARLDRFVKGDEDEHLEAAMDALRNLADEVTKRGRILAQLGGEETKVTRELAVRDARLKPKLVIFDECQELFRHPQYGEEAKELAIKVMMKARKCAITTVWVTPAPSALSLPRDLAKTTSHAVCFAIRDHQGNDAILGTGAHKAGISATSLIPGEDVGIAMASGFNSAPGLLRTFYIRREKGVDELTPIVERAMEGWIPRQRAGDAPSAPRVADPLTDVAAVLKAEGVERMRTQEVLAFLAEMDRRAYGSWTFTDLKVALPDACAPYKSAGVMVIAADRVTEALADRRDGLDG